MRNGPLIPSFLKETSVGRGRSTVVVAIVILWHRSSAPASSAPEKRAADERTGAARHAHTSESTYIRARTVQIEQQSIESLLQFISDSRVGASAVGPFCLSLCPPPPFPFPSTLSFGPFCLSSVLNGNRGVPVWLSNR